MDAKIIFVIKYSCLITLCNSITSPQQNAFTEKPIPHLLNCCFVGYCDWPNYSSSCSPLHFAASTWIKHSLCHYHSPQAWWTFNLQSILIFIKKNKFHKILTLIFIFKLAKSSVFFSTLIWLRFYCLCCCALRLNFCAVQHVIFTLQRPGNKKAHAVFEMWKCFSLKH